MDSSSSIGTQRDAEPTILKRVTGWFFSPDGDSQLLSSYADALGVKHLVQGHEPGDVVFSDGLRRNSGEMFQRYGLLFLTDTGMSKAIDYSDGAILHIQRTTDNVVVDAICGDGSKTELWSDTEQQDFGRSPRCKN